MSRKVAVAPVKADRIGIKIRSARAKDAGRIAVLSKQLGYPVSTKEMGKRIATVSRRRAQKLIVAELNGQVVGWVEVFRPVSVLNWGKAEVGALVVDGEIRGLGVGGRLLDAARTWSQDARSQFVYLRSNIKREDAHRFYKKAGYKIHKTQFVFQLLLNKQ